MRSETVHHEGLLSLLRHFRQGNQQGKPGSAAGVNPCTVHPHGTLRGPRRTEGA